MDVDIHSFIFAFDLQLLQVQAGCPVPLSDRLHVASCGEGRSCSLEAVCVIWTDKPHCCLCCCHVLFPSNTPASRRRSLAQRRTLKIVLLLVLPLRPSRCSCLCCCPAPLPPGGAPAKKERKPRKKKDPNAPKKALSAFMYFSNANRDKIKTANPGIPFGQVRCVCITHKLVTACGAFRRLFQVVQRGTLARALGRHARTHTLQHTCAQNLCTGRQHQVACSQAPTHTLTVTPCPILLSIKHCHTVVFAGWQAAW
jgi:hypothetical protein